MIEIGIYKIQSRIKPSRVYIGSSVNIYNRWRQHRYDLRHNNHSSRTLQRHFNKYGEMDLEFSIVCICDRENLIPENGVIWLEQCYILAYKEPSKLKPYFNANITAGSNIGLKHTKKSKAKISLAQIGRTPSVMSEEGRRRNSESKMGNTYGKGNKGRHHSMAARKKISIGHKGKNNNTPEQIENTRKRMMGNTYARLGDHTNIKPITEETRRKLRESHMGQKKSQETINQWRISMMLRKIENELMDLLLEAEERKKNVS